MTFVKRIIEFIIFLLIFEICFSSGIYLKKKYFFLFIIFKDYLLRTKGFLTINAVSFMTIHSVSTVNCKKYCLELFQYK